MSNEKDRTTAFKLVRDCGGTDNTGLLRRQIEAALTTARKEAREEAFTTIGVELRRYGANIRKVDLLARFQELFREGEAAATTQKGENDAERR